MAPCGYALAYLMVSNASRAGRGRSQKNPDWRSLQIRQFSVICSPYGELMGDRPLAFWAHHSILLTDLQPLTTVLCAASHTPNVILKGAFPVYVPLVLKFSAHCPLPHPTAAFPRVKGSAPFPWAAVPASGGLLRHARVATPPCLRLPRFDGFRGSFLPPGRPRAMCSSLHGAGCRLALR